MPDSLLVEREVLTEERSLPAAEALGELASPDSASNMTIPPPPQP